MKRLTPRYRRWLSHRQKSVRAKAAAKQEKNALSDRRQRFVTAWNGDESIRISVERKPEEPVSHLCLNENYTRTANFLGRWQARIKASAYRNRNKGTWLSIIGKNEIPRIRSYYDFSKILEISTAASVVIAAEYERGRILVGSPPPAIELDKWSSGAFGKLYEMGFFEAVGLSAAESRRFLNSNGTVTMQIVSGETSAELQDAVNKLEELLIEEFELEEELQAMLVWINTAVSEAITNVSHWAYLGANPLQPERWWLAATVEPLTRNLSLVFYDQGVTIPKSIQGKNWVQDMVSYARRAIGMREASEDWSDSQWISAALEYGRSRSRLDNRGKGLPQLAELLDHSQDGSLRIVSRKGCCYLRKGQKLVEESAIRHPLMGTLIEWNLSLPEHQ